MPHKFLTWVELAGHVAPFSLDVLAIGEHSIVKNITFGTGLSQLAHTGVQSTNQRHFGRLQEPLTLQDDSCFLQLRVIS